MTQEVADGDAARAVLIHQPEVGVEQLLDRYIETDTETIHRANL